MTGVIRSNLPILPKFLIIRFQQFFRNLWVTQWSLSLKRTHSFCLLCGTMGLISLGAIAQNTWTNIITNKYLLLLSMLGVGIVWASVLAMPYAIAEVELSEDTVMET
jgi:hypothetical protein